MEQEALRRAQEMHSRTKRPSPAENQKPPAPPLKEQPVHSQKEEKRPNVNSGGALDSLFADKEKLLILSLILILSSEERNDPSLTLALLYLII